MRKLYNKILRMFFNRLPKQRKFKYKEFIPSDSLKLKADLKNISKAYETTDGRYQIFYDEIKGYKHLRIRRANMKPLHSWSDLQTIKNDLLGISVIAIEIYPKHIETVDCSNSYHLWTWEGIDVPNLWDIYK